MLEKIFIITLVVWAVHAVFWNGMIFGPVSRWISYRTPRWLQMPLYGCALCQTPYYGSAIYWLVWANSWQEWLVCVAGAMGVSAIIINFSSGDAPQDLPEDSAED